MSVPKAVPRGSMSAAAMAYVRERILSKSFTPGEVVRPEAIGAALGISQTPAREALQALRTEGFLANQPGVGFVVSPLTGDDLRDIFVAHALIASEIAARAAGAVTAAEVAELEAIQFELLAAEKRRLPDEVGARNHEFHRLISRIGGSPKLNRILSIVSHYVPRSFYSSISGWSGASAHDHARILAAFAAGDPAEARAAMYEHIRNAGELLASSFDVDDAGA